MIRGVIRSPVFYNSSAVQPVFVNNTDASHKPRDYIANSWIYMSLLFLPFVIPPFSKYDRFKHKASITAMAGLGTGGIMLIAGKLLHKLYKAMQSKTPSQDTRQNPSITQALTNISLFGVAGIGGLAFNALSMTPERIQKSKFIKNTHNMSVNAGFGLTILIPLFLGEVAYTTYQNKLK